jgi:PHD and RING finger domain-containing protein 1
VKPNGADDDHPAVHEVDSNDSRGQEDDKHHSANEGEQIAGHASADYSSVKCPVCSATFTTQEVGTPDTCDHTFCATCLQEWSKNDNKCPVDRQMFNTILLRRHLEGEIITRIPVKPTRRQGECDRQNSPLWCILARPLFLAECVLHPLAIWTLLKLYFPR